MSRNQRAREALMQRRLGMGETERARLKVANAKMDDWVGVCRKCGTRLEGRIDELKEHECGEQDTIDT